MLNGGPRQTRRALIDGVGDRCKRKAATKGEGHCANLEPRTNLAVRNALPKAPHLEKRAFLPRGIWRCKRDLGVSLPVGADMPIPSELNGAAQERRTDGDGAKRENQRLVAYRLSILERRKRD